MLIVYAGVSLCLEGYWSMRPVAEASNPTKTLSLVERYRRGDQEAARLLFDRYVQQLLGSDQLEAAAGTCSPVRVRGRGPIGTQEPVPAL